MGWNTMPVASSAAAAAAAAASSCFISCWRISRWAYETGSLRDQEHTSSSSWSACTRKVPTLLGLYAEALGHTTGMQLSATGTQGWVGSLSSCDESTAVMPSSLPSSSLVSSSESRKRSSRCHGVRSVNACQACRGRQRV